MVTVKIEECEDEKPPSAAAAPVSSAMRPSSKKPLYIMFGPPCSGKTTWLKERDVVGVSLNDQPNVYIPVPMNVWAQLVIRETSDDDADDGGANDQTNAIFDDGRVLYGKSIRDRILGNDNFELQWVLRRLVGTADQNELKNALTQNYNTNSEMLPRLLACIEDILQEERACGDSVSRPANVDLFVREALWKQDTRTGLSGFDSAKRALSNVDPLSNAAGLDNTNTKVNDYRGDLARAEREQRPVHFVVYDCIEESILPQGLENSLYVGSLTDLVRRNLQRFLKTGRYVPSKVILDMHHRTVSLLKQALPTAGQSKPIKLEVASDNPLPTHECTKFDLDTKLCTIAGFKLKSDRTVVSLGPQRGEEGRTLDRRARFTHGSNARRSFDRRRDSPYYTNSDAGFRGVGRNEQYHRGENRQNFVPPRRHFYNPQPGTSRRDGSHNQQGRSYPNDRPRQRHHNRYR